MITFPGGATVTSINGKDIATQICGQPIGNVANDIADLQSAFQAATAAAGPAANGSYLGNTLSSSVGTGPMFGPKYQTPRSYQMNIGIQREIAKNTVLSVDYLRNVGLHTLLAIDANFNGDARFLDIAGAQGAIATTLANCGVATIDQSLVNCATDPGTGTNDGGKWVPRPAVIGDYAGNGLSSGALLDGGSPAGPGNVAFPGKNANFGTVGLLQPVGRSMYNALEVKLKSDLHNPAPGVKNLSMQFSYSFSRYTSAAQDSDFINTPSANVNPNRFNGPNSLDRTHQFSAGVVSELPFGVKINFITHWDSALPQNIIFTCPEMRKTYSSTIRG